MKEVRNLQEAVKRYLADPPKGVPYPLLEEVRAVQAELTPERPSPGQKATQEAYGRPDPA